MIVKRETGKDREEVEIESKEEKRLKVELWFFQFFCRTWFLIVKKGTGKGREGERIISIMFVTKHFIGEKMEIKFTENRKKNGFVP